MDKQKQKEQADKLKELAKKPVSEQVAKSIKEKQAYINRYINK